VLRTYYFPQLYLKETYLFKSLREKSWNTKERCRQGVNEDGGGIKSDWTALWGYWEELARKGGKYALHYSLFFPLFLKPWTPLACQSFCHPLGSRG